MIPAQPVRAEPSIMAVVGGSKRTLTHHGRPDQSIDVLDRLDLRLDNPHSSRGYPAAAKNFNGFVFYNTVILRRWGVCFVSGGVISWRPVVGGS